MKSLLPARRTLSPLTLSICAAFLAIPLLQCTLIDRAPTGESIEKQSRPAVPAPPPPPVEIKGTNPALEAGRVILQSVSDLSQLSAGPAINTRWNDILLANDHVRCVFGNPTPPEGEEFRPGALLDLARRPTERDYLWVFLPNHGDRTAKMVPVSVETRTDGYPNNAVAVVVRHESKLVKGLTALTEYILEPDDPSIRIVTTWENNSEKALENLDLGDVMDWAMGSALVPGRGMIEAGKPLVGQAEYFAVLEHHDTYAFAPKKGTVRVDALASAVGAVYDTVTLPVGDKAVIERRLFVGDKDVAALGGKAYEYQDMPYGWIAGRLTEVTYTPDKRLVDLGPVANGEIQVVAGKRHGKLLDALGFTRSFTNENGEFIVPLPEGAFHIRGYKLGHIQPQPNYGVEVRPNQTTALDLTIGPACRVELNVLDSATSQPMPCKVAFVNMINTAPVFFGPPDSLAGQNAYYSATGRETFSVEPGNYRVVISRGPEYDTVEKLVRLQPGKVHALDAVLPRVVPTGGWISVDAGVKTDASRGCLVSPADRVVAAAAEGVEFLFTGDDHTPTNLAPAIQEAGLGQHINAGIGMQINATWTNPLGVFYLLPLPADTPPADIQPTGSAKSLFSTLRQRYPAALLAVLRPIFPDVGYYALAGYDQKTHRLPKGAGFSHDYDVLEVWEGKRVGARGLSLPVFWAEVFSGRRHGLLAATHSASLQDQEAGYPRTYVAVSNDNPQLVSEKEIVDSLRAGRVVLTNGPFIEFTVQGQGPGAMVRPDSEGYVDVEMRVWAANWVNTFAYEFDQNSLFLTTNISPGGNITEPLRYPREGDKKTRRIKCKTDCVLNGAVSGARTLAPVVSPFAKSDEGQVLPYAITGPVYVDADGDGKCIPPKPTAYQAMDEEREIED